MSRIYVVLKRCLLGVVLIAANVAQQLFGLVGNLYAHKLLLAFACRQSLAALPLLQVVFLGYVRKHIGHIVRYIDALFGGVVLLGVVVLHAHRVGMLSLEGVGQSGEESLSALHHLVNRHLVVFHLCRLGMDHHRVGALVQTVHLFGQEAVALVLGHELHDEKRVLAFHAQQEL